MELFRVIGRYHCDSVVWAGQADCEEVLNGGLNGKVTYGRMQAAMHRRLEHNAKVIFKSAESGAHHDWVSATSFDELVSKIDGWHDVVFQWMDDMVSATLPRKIFILFIHHGLGYTSGIQLEGFLTR
jgi:hypothetical protein